MSTTNGSEERGMIMLSYCWADKDLVYKIRYHLWKEGFRVWIDVCKQDGMRNHIYSDMAIAVEEATVVICCLSLDYENSVNCKREGSYTAINNKPCIPLLMKKYKFNDWVGIIHAATLYIDFSEPSNFEKSFEELLHRLEDYQLQLNPQKDNPTPSFLPEPEPSAARLNPDPPTTASDETDAPSSSDKEATNLISELSEMEYNMLLVNVSDHWDKCGDINMLKVLLLDFKEIGTADIQKTDDIFELFRLLRSAGKISPSNIDVIAEAATLCGIGSMKEVIRKTLRDYSESSEIHEFTKFCRNVVEFGKKVTVQNLKTIMKLYGVSYKQNQDDTWYLIFELQINDKLTLNNKESFIETLREKKMTREADALNTY